MVCTGTIPFFAPSILFDEVTETAEDVRQLVKQVSESVIRTPSSILAYMRGHRLTVDDISRNVFLIRAYNCDDAKRTRVDLLTMQTTTFFQPSLPQVLL